MYSAEAERTHLRGNAAVGSLGKNHLAASKAVTVCCRSREVTGRSHIVEASSSIQECKGQCCAMLLKGPREGATGGLRECHEVHRIHCDVVGCTESGNVISRHVTIQPCPRRDDRTAACIPFQGMERVLLEPSENCHDMHRICCIVMWLPSNRPVNVQRVQHEMGILGVGTALQCMPKSMYTLPSSIMCSH